MNRLMAAGVCLLLLLADVRSTYGFALGDRQSPPLNILPICAIQGDYFKSDYTGKLARTRGVVTADLDNTSKKGFFIQKEGCDSDPVTSDGIFVNLGARQDVVAVRDFVEVLGVVQEDYGNTEISVITGTVTVVSRDAPLPVYTDLRPPMDHNASRWYYESLEGMAVRLDDAQVVGPTDSSNDTWVVRSDLGLLRVFQDDPAGTGEVVSIDDGGLFQVTPQAAVGDRLLNLRGVLDYDFGEYRLLLTEQPSLTAAALNMQTTPRFSNSSPEAITLATLNLQDLFDTVNDPDKNDKELSFKEYSRRLQKFALLIHDVLGEPDLLAVEEAENKAVLDDLAAFTGIQADYRTLLVEGPDLRGQDVALLYRTDRIEIIESQVYQGCTTLVDGLGVDGNQDVYNPQNSITCDANGDGILDGNRLFSRPPLRVRIRGCIPDCGNGQPPTDEVELTLIINHFKSKYEDGPVTQFTLPRRIQEAQFLADLVQHLHSAKPDASLFILGDLNDFPASQPLLILKSAGLHDLTLLIPHDERFSYNFHGISQVLDYVLYYAVPGLAPMTARYYHINADYPAGMQSRPEIVYRSSDHDPLLVTLLPLPYRCYFPWAVR